MRQEFDDFVLEVQSDELEVDVVDIQKFGYEKMDEDLQVHGELLWSQGNIKVKHSWSMISRQDGHEHEHEMYIIYDPCNGDFWYVRKMDGKFMDVMVMEPDTMLRVVDFNI